MMELSAQLAVRTGMIKSKASTKTFFFLTFLITWGLQLPGVFAQWGFLPGDPQLYMPFVGLGIFGPLIAASVLTARAEGRAGLKALFSRLKIYRVSPLWYATALLLPALLLTAALSLLNLTGRSGPVDFVPPAAGLVLGMVISIAEEVGWRGYALPRLSKSYGPFAASLLLGVIWGVWHIPMFLGVGISMDLALVMLLYFTGASLFITWIARGTGGSLLLVSLAHLGTHLNNSTRALPDEVVPLVVHAIIFAALGLFVMRRLIHEGPGLRSSHQPTTIRGQGSPA